MFLLGIISKQVDSIRWQDYRGQNTGMVVYYNTEPVSKLPIREVAEELPSDVIPEPNYETATFGFYGCKHSKIRSSFTKKKIRFLFFMTRYSGMKAEYAEDLMVTGFYKIKQIADVQKLHIRYLNEYSCINEDTCSALRADMVHFVSVEDAFKITPEALESWACKSRVTRQTKIILDEEKTDELIKYLKAKKNIVDVYSEETERLQPGIEDEDEGEDEDFEDYEGYVDEEDNEDLRDDKDKETNEGY